MWRKHQNVYKDHLKYVRDVILKPFRVVILCCAKRIMEMHDLAKYLPSPLMKGESYKSANWKFCDQELSVIDIRVAIKGGLPSSINNELEDNQEGYHYLTHKYWCDLLSTIDLS